MVRNINVSAFLSIKCLIKGRQKEDTGRYREVMDDEEK
jgi:hypothetical protein